MPWLLILTLIIAGLLSLCGCTNRTASKEPDTETILAYYATYGEAKTNEIRLKEGW